MSPTAAKDFWRSRSTNITDRGIHITKTHNWKDKKHITEKIFFDFTTDRVYLITDLITYHIEDLIADLINSYEKETFINRLRNYEIFLISV